MANSPDAGSRAVAVAPPMPLQLRVQLSTMMFLQYAIWGAWLPLLYSYLSSSHSQLYGASQIGDMFAVGASGQSSLRFSRANLPIGISRPRNSWPSAI